MSVTILETINWPGAGLTAGARKITGDDRFGFDESAGTAWVLDGATDVGPYRLFTKQESDAAWIAEAYNQELMRRGGADSGDVAAFFTEVIKAVTTRAETESRVRLHTADASTLPIASGMWMQCTGSTACFVRFGDCIALIRTPDGQTEVLEHRVQADRETETSRQLNALTPEDRLAGLREIRARQNTIEGYPILGLNTGAVAGMVTELRDLSEGSHVLLMSDGLWRIVDVYHMMTAEEMMDAALEAGIEPLAKAMRQFEKAGGQDATVRIKASDDACGVLLRV